MMLQHRRVVRRFVRQLALLIPLSFGAISFSPPAAAQTAVAGRKTTIEQTASSPTGASAREVNVPGGTSRATIPTDDKSALSGPSPDSLAATASAAGRPVSPTVALYYDPQAGASSSDLVSRALSTNAELAASRLETTRARARLTQAGLRPNPTIDFEQTSGGILGSRGESQTSIGVALPVDVGGKRRGRVALAQAELEAVEADIANRERLLAAEVRSLYADALAALRELETTEGLTNLDLQTARVVQTRVNEGDAAPLELNLLQVEVERLRSRRSLVEGRLRSSLIRLASLTGTPPGDALRLREDIVNPMLPAPPASPEAAVETALRTRPDLRLARLNEEVAKAGLRLARANARPDVTAFTRYARSSSAFDETPVGFLQDRDDLLTFGASVSIPVFDRGQAAKAGAGLAIEQAARRREFAEAVVRSDVTAAYARYEAARAAVGAFQRGVIERSNDNIRVIRAAYDLGEYRVTDLINEQRRLVDSQREFTEALADQYRALADLQAALGAPVETRQPQQQQQQQ